MNKKARKRKVGTEGRFSAIQKPDQLYYLDAGEKPGLKLEEIPVLARFLLDLYTKEKKRLKDKANDSLQLGMDHGSGEVSF